MYLYFMRLVSIWLHPNCLRTELKCLHIKAIDTFGYLSHVHYRKNCHNLSRNHLDFLLTISIPLLISRLVSNIPPKYVTDSGKSGLIAYFKVSRKHGFKYLKCYSSPMPVATCMNFLHVLQKYVTFQIIHWPSSQQPSFPWF